MVVAILRGLIGIATLVFIAWVFSRNRKSIDWSLFGKGLAFQLVIAVLILKVSFITNLFDWISRGFVKLISFTNYGSDFLMGSFATGDVAPGLQNFAFYILPTIIFFSAISAILYHYGILQKVVYAFAWIMKRLMKLSGAESLAAAGNIFLGQTESPLLVRPYLSKKRKLIQFFTARCLHKVVQI